MIDGAKAFSGFSVNDKEAALKFYSEVLGLDISDNDMGLSLKAGSGNDIFIYVKDNHEPASFTILNFPVDDIDVTIDELSSKGVVMEKYDNLPAPQDDKGILRGRAAGQGPDIAWFKDPAGNVLSVLQN